MRGSAAGVSVDLDGGIGAITFRKPPGPLEGKSVGANGSDVDIGSDRHDLRVGADKSARCAIKTVIGHGHTQRLKAGGFF